MLDGVEPDGMGSMLITDNMGGRLLQQAPGGAAAEVAKLEPGAADHEFVPDLGLIVVPLTPAGDTGSRPARIFWTGWPPR